MTVIARVICDIWDKLIERHDNRYCHCYRHWQQMMQCFLLKSSGRFLTLASDNVERLVASPRRLCLFWHCTRNVCVPVKIAENSCTAWTRDSPLDPLRHQRRRVKCFFLSLLVQHTLSFAVRFVSLKNDSGSIECCNADRSRERRDVRTCRLKRSRMIISERNYSCDTKRA